MNRIDSRCSTLVVCLRTTVAAGFAAALSIEAHAGGSIPASADVAGSGQVDIGTMTPTVGAGGITIDFAFAPEYSFLDDWYDFQWLSMEVGYSVNGVPQANDPVLGPLPAIDPQLSDGPEPFYYNDAEWSSGVFGGHVIHTEGTGSQFRDARSDPGVNSVITFHTFLVVTPVTDTSFRATDFCVLEGIEWTYTQSTGATAWTASLIPNANNQTDINNALNNANPPFPDTWNPMIDCTLSACPVIWDCVFCSVPTVTYSPSDWTSSGKIIGQTFSTGVTPQPSVPAYDDGILPVYPNDWHWGVTYPCGSSGGQLSVDVVNFGPNDHITVQVICSPMFGPQPLHLQVDYGANAYTLSLLNGPPIWQGQWSQYPSDIPPHLQFAPTGNVRRNFTSPPTGVVINEIRIDEPGTDNNEYFELMGPPGMPLSGLTYLVIGDNQPVQGSGVIEAVVPLNGSIPSSGLFVVAEPTFTLGVPNMVAPLNFENDDNVTHLLVQGFSGTLNQDLDTNDDGILDIRPWQTILDLIALVKQPNPPTTTEYSYGPPSLGPDVTFVPGQVYRCRPDGLWRVGQFDIAMGTDTPGAPNLLCAPPPPPTGGCCVSDGTCFQATQTTCAAFGGTYQGNGTNCGNVTCVAPCPSDINGDHVVNTGDLLTVINGWGGNGAADINHDGVVNTADLLLVINHWGPCPT